MSGRDKLAGRVAEECDDPVVAGALRHFKASVDAWSGAAYSRPRTAVMKPTAHLAPGRNLGSGLPAGGGKPCGHVVRTACTGRVGADRSSKRNQGRAAKGRGGAPGRRTACHGRNRRQAATDRGKTRSQRR